MRSYLFLFLILIANSCLYFHREAYEIPGDKLTGDKNYTIESPTKIHLKDGRVIVYEEGFLLKDKTIFGLGLSYNFERTAFDTVYKFPFDSTAFYEYYNTNFEWQTHILSAPAALLGTTALAVAIFGSCPTIYSNSFTTSLLEAECFSYSVAEMFEQDDLDKLNFLSPYHDTATIVISNEALETHYIDKLKLGVAEHPKQYSAFPTDEEEILLFGKASPLIKAFSGDGRDVRSLISKKDSAFYRTKNELVEELQNKITRDWIDLEIEVPDNANEAVLVFNYRNTLLNTILLYDVMLGSQGGEAIDWIGDKTSNLWYAYNFDKWYSSNFGIHIKILNEGKYEEVYRIGDTGPIVWHESAYKLDVPVNNILKLRLEFLPDNFMIDWVGISFDISEDFEYKEYPISELKTIMRNKTQSLQLLNENDSDYYITYPGENYQLNYHLDPIGKNKVRSYFIASRGYYVEWIRKEWIEYGAKLDDSVVFDYNDEAIKNSARHWLDKKEDFESRFFRTKVK